MAYVRPEMNVATDRTYKNDVIDCSQQCYVTVWNHFNFFV